MKIILALTLLAVALPCGAQDFTKSERFYMQQNGKNMSADDFDAWMQARGIRIVGNASSMAQVNRQNSPQRSYNQIQIQPQSQSQASSVSTTMNMNTSTSASYNASSYQAPAYSAPTYASLNPGTAQSGYTTYQSQQNNQSYQSYQSHQSHQSHQYSEDSYYPEGNSNSSNQANQVYVENSSVSSQYTPQVASYSNNVTVERGDGYGGYYTSPQNSNSNNDSNVIVTRTVVLRTGGSSQPSSYSYAPQPQPQKYSEQGYVNITSP